MHQALLPQPLSILTLALCFLVYPSSAQAKGWGLGIGYHNPVSADLGVSVLYLFDSFAFEAAVGALGLWEDDNDGGLVFGGDLDLKWVFGSKVKGYLQGGMGFGAGTSTNGSGLSLGSPFAGAGVFLVGSSVYGLLGGDYIFNASDVQLTGTLGFFL